MTPSDLANHPTRLFFYGTLKRGHCRAPMLAGQQFLRAVRTAPIYRLVNCGSYPGMVLAETGRGSAVEGELWQVDGDCLALLDREEGVDVGLYQRAPIAMEDPSPLVEAYFYLRDTSSMADCGNCWTLEFERKMLGGD